MSAGPDVPSSPPVTRVIGLTGGIGTGKSTVSRMLAELGAVVIDADAIVHELQASGMPVLDEIADAFGTDMIRPDGSLDREALGARVFGDEAARTRLGQIIHPKVGVEMGRRLAEARDRGRPLVVLDIPLLLEGRKKAGGARTGRPADGVEAVVLVYAREDQQIERQQTRDGATREQAEARVRAQLPIDEKREMADYVIDNSGTLEETRAQVEALYAKLCGA